MLKAEIRRIFDAWRCYGPNAGLDNAAADEQVWWLIDGAASKVVERGFSDALPILEQLGIDEISLKREFQVVKWQSIFSEKGSSKIGGGLCFDKHSDCNFVSVVGESMQFKWAPRDGVIIKYGSDEATQISAKIKEHRKRHTQLSSIQDNSNNDNAANVGMSRILSSKRNKPAAVAAAATLSSQKNTAVSLAQNNAEDDDGNMLVDDEDSLDGDAVAVPTLKQKKAVGCTRWGINSSECV